MSDWHGCVTDVGCSMDCVGKGSGPGLEEGVVEAVLKYLELTLAKLDSHRTRSIQILTQVRYHS